MAGKVAAAGCEDLMTALQGKRLPLSWFGVAFAVPCCKGAPADVTLGARGLVARAAVVTLRQLAALR